MAASVPLTVLNDKLKQKDDSHALAVAELQSTEDVSEECQLEVIRLCEDVERLQGAKKQRLDEVEILWKNGEDLKLKLKQAIDAHDQTVLVTKERELENEQLVCGLVLEAERVDQAILGNK